MVILHQSTKLFTSPLFSSFCPFLIHPITVIRVLLQVAWIWVASKMWGIEGEEKHPQDLPLKVPCVAQHHIRQGVPLWPVRQIVIQETVDVLPPTHSPTGKAKKNYHTASPTIQILVSMMSQQTQECPMPGPSVDKAGSGPVYPSWFVT